MQFTRNKKDTFTGVFFCLVDHQLRREKSLSMIFQPKVPDQEAERNDADWIVDYLCGKAKEHTLSDMLFFWWTIRDSNPGPTGYEPVALTN